MESVNEMLEYLDKYAKRYAKSVRLMKNEPVFCERHTEEVLAIFNELFSKDVVHKTVSLLDIQKENGKYNVQDEVLLKMNRYNFDLVFSSGGGKIKGGKRELFYKRRHLHELEKVKNKRIFDMIGGIFEDIVLEIFLVVYEDRR